ncbi:DUF2971 domain-containing protein [uncultured Psychromonas sp.]|uniref:DUF2971 domain-containing protein n=1 Tax=uncultured Psychromonas sp. TaxID=173974 RepID=UPI002635C3F4|nr:DUF2971 domain-containing protein [uncultured Psychromonas sp.]
MILQRYMDLSKFMYLLQKSSLFLPKMSLFDDHLEGGLTAIDYLSSSNDFAHLDIGMCSAGTSNIEKANEKVNQRLFETPFGEYKRNDLDKIFPRCREWLYVSCWHKSSHECSAMWSIYGGVNNSVCILTTEDKLLNQIQKPKNVNKIKLEDVEYLDHKYGQLTGSDSLAPFLAKSLPFSFEKETRLIAYNTEIDLSRVNKNPDAGVEVSIESLEQLIDKVVISPKADIWFSDSIKQLCNSNGLNIVEDSTLRKKRFMGSLEAYAQLEENVL